MARLWQAAVVHINGLPDRAAVDQLFCKINRATPLIAACSLSAPLELVQLMITKTKLDERKRYLVCGPWVHLRRKTLTLKML